MRATWCGFDSTCFRLDNRGLSNSHSMPAVDPNPPQPSQSSVAPGELASATRTHSHAKLTILDKECNITVNVREGSRSDGATVEQGNRDTSASGRSGRPTTSPPRQAGITGPSPRADSSAAAVNIDGSEWWSLGGTVAHAAKVAHFERANGDRVAFPHNATVPDGEVMFTISAGGATIREGTQYRRGKSDQSGPSPEQGSKDDSSEPQRQVDAVSTE